MTIVDTLGSTRPDHTHFRCVIGADSQYGHNHYCEIVAEECDDAECFNDGEVHELAMTRMPATEPTLDLAEIEARAKSFGPITWSVPSDKVLADLFDLIAEVRRLREQCDAERATVERLREYHAQDWKARRAREDELLARLIDAANVHGEYLRRAEAAEEEVRCLQAENKRLDSLWTETTLEVICKTDRVNAAEEENKQLRSAVARVGRARQCDDADDCECVCCKAFRAALHGEPPRAEADEATP